jgi:phosphate-selective porin OprO and OprP
MKQSLLAVTCSTILSIPTYVNADYADTQITGKGEGIRFQQGDIQYELGGRIVFDYDRFYGIYEDTDKAGRGTELRRGRVYIKGALNKNWQSKLQVEINDEKQRAQFKDLYVKYKGLEWANLMIGKAKEPFGLETIASSKFIAPIERAMISDAFAPSRSYGVTFLTQLNQATFAGGIYAEDPDEGHQETFALTGRMTYAPIMTKNMVLHFGIAGSYRDLGGNDHQIQKTSEVHLAHKIITSQDITTTNNVNLLGVEAAVILGSFSFQTEYMSVHVDPESNTNAQAANYDGYYALASYFLTGQRDSYKKSHFGKFNPSSAQNVWQLFTRFSHIDTIDNEAGVEADNITVGVNYYPNLQIRISANYIMTDITNADATEDDGKAFSLRFQYLF